MKFPTEETIQAYVVWLAERAGVSAERIDELRAKYQRWQDRFRQHPLFEKLRSHIDEAWHFLRSPSVPQRDKAVVLAAICYVVIPVDLVPDWLPIVGLIDDLAAMAVAMGIIQRHRQQRDDDEDAAESDERDGDAVPEHDPPNAKTA